MDSRIETLLDALVNGGTLPEDYEPMSRNEAYLYALYKKGVGGSGGVQPDWNQNDETAPDYMKNRTHYDSRRTKEVVFEFDGVLDGKEYIVLDDTVYAVKVSNEVPENLEDLIDSSVSFVTPDGMQTHTIIEDDIRLLTDNLYTIGELLTVAYDETTLGSTTFTKGIYFMAITDGTNMMAYHQKLSCNVVSGELKQLDEKYLPDGIGVQSDWTVEDETTKAYIHNKPAIWAGAGENSIVEGYKENVASGSHSHAEGNDTTASGNYSHAEGSNTTASGNFSHAEGSNTTASGSYSHAKGKDTKATKYASHAEGEATNANGNCSHAEGQCTIASGAWSHAEGQSTTASGSGAHAEGQSATASGAYSHAEGNSTDACSDYQHVQGKWNIEDTEGKYAHIVGNGTGEVDENGVHRSNAHTLDWDGNAWYAGGIELTSPNGTRYRFTVSDDGTLISAVVE